MHSLLFCFFASLFLFSTTDPLPFGKLPGKPTVVIDAGHGGHDRGAREEKPFCEEKRLSLHTARLVKKYLDQLGYRVIMTRETDVFVSLNRRVEIAKQARSHIFVSIHFNSARAPEASGIEIFFHDGEKEKVRASASKRLADVILSRLIRRTAAHSRGIKRGNFYVIREAHMPAVLIEAGFISNRAERIQLRSTEYQEKIARGIVDGIECYFKRQRNVLGGS